MPTNHDYLLYNFHSRSRQNDMLHNLLLRSIFNHQNHSSPTGADMNTIKSYTTESKYKKNTKEDAESKSSDAKVNANDDEEEEKCAICWSEFNEDEDVRYAFCYLDCLIGF